jgi:hypothetical protein
MVVPCFQTTCKKKSTVYRGHYHCICGEMLSRKEWMLHHVEVGKEHVQIIHDIKRDIVESEESDHDDIFLAPTSADGNENPDNAGKCAGIPKVVVRGSHTCCTICGALITRRCMYRHMRVLHPEITAESGVLPSVLVSASDGLYMVSKVLKGGQHPIHVQFSTSTTVQRVLCESTECDESGKAHARGGIKSFACSHITAVKSAVLPETQRQAVAEDVERMLAQRIFQSSSAHDVENILSRLNV